MLCSWHSTKTEDQVHIQYDREHHSLAYCRDVVCAH